MNVFVINLDRDTTRYKEISNHLTKFGIPFTRIKGIDGNKLTLKEIKDNSTKICSLFCARSQIGCYLSHLNAWKKIAMGAELYGIVMEDDCRIEPNFVEVIQRIDNVPFDFIYLGCFGACGGGSKGENLDFIGRMYDTFLFNSSNQSPHSLLEIPKFPLGFHCYMISKKCAQNLVSILELADFHVDGKLAIMQSKLGLKMYSLKVPVAYQYSTNKNSSLSTEKYPPLFLRLTDSVVLKQQISLGYYLGSPLFAVGNLNISLIGIILFFITTFLLLKQRQFLIYWFGYLLLEYSLSPSPIFIVLLVITLVILIPMA